MSTHTFDLAIVGGGINGCGIAADAAGRGLKVLLVERGDLAGATSSASSKLIHGGLRYLEHWEFRLVREALQEREVLLAKAPHIIWPLRFVLPMADGMRPRPMIRAGLWLYDHLARRPTIPGSTGLDLAREAAGEVLNPAYRDGFSYWDCWVDDSRLVVLNARAAADRGADIRTRTELEAARAEDGHWRLGLKSAGETREVRARAVVNAAGPWVDDVTRRVRDGSRGHNLSRIRLVKGSHIVVPRMCSAADAFILQNADGRVVFVLPFEDRYSIIGTTDVTVTGDVTAIAISAEETAYLLDVARRYFKSPPAERDIVWSYAGVRPLVEDQSDSASAVTRDYRLELEAEPGMPPWLSILGGKVTTYRRLAEAVLERLEPRLPAMGPAWTAHAPLPGGDLKGATVAEARHDLARRYPGLGPALLNRLFRQQGSRAADLLGDARTEGDLGEALPGGLSAREVSFLKRTEWALAPEDVLWRRTKCGLTIPRAGLEAAAQLIARHL